MNGKIKFRDELTGEVKTYEDWEIFASSQDSRISSLNYENDDRQMIRKNATKELVADLVRIEH